SSRALACLGVSCMVPELRTEKVSGPTGNPQGSRMRHTMSMGGGSQPSGKGLSSVVRPTALFYSRAPSSSWTAPAFRVRACRPPRPWERIIMSRVLDVLLLFALPASGKSEVRRYLASLTPEQCRNDFHLGPTVQLDDYPYVHMMRRVSQELRRLGRDGVFFDSDDLPMKQPLDWGTLIELLNEDFDDLAQRSRPAPFDPLRLGHARGVAPQEHRAHRSHRSRLDPPSRGPDGGDDGRLRLRRHGVVDPELRPSRYRAYRGSRQGLLLAGGAFRQPGGQDDVRSRRPLAVEEGRRRGAAPGAGRGVRAAR